MEGAGRTLSFLTRSKVRYVIVVFMVTLFGTFVLYRVGSGGNPAMKGFLNALFLAPSIESTVGFGNLVVVTNGGKIIRSSNLGRSRLEERVEMERELEKLRRRSPVKG
jgi:hypothetical protein